MTRRTTLVLLAVGLFAPAARAQGPDLGVTVGDRVRVTWCPRPGDGCPGKRRAKGLLLHADSATLSLMSDRRELAVPAAALLRVERSRGSHSPLRAVLFGVGGFVLGGVAGIAVGTLVQGDCVELGCLAGPVYGLLVGAPVGLAAGVTFGVTTRERWSTTWDGAGTSWAPRVGPTAPGHVGVAVVVAF